MQKETIDQLYEGIAVFGSDGRLKLHNPAYAKLWGLGEEDLAGEPHVAKIVDLVQAYFDGPSDWKEITVLGKPSGGKKTYQVYLYVTGGGTIWLDDVALVPVGGQLEE